jgi:hypothetical protein
MSHFFRVLKERTEAVGADKARDERRALSILNGCNEKQKAPIFSIMAGFKYLAIRCPRRSGKSFGATSLALWYGEKFPGSRILIISLTLKSTRENYWSGAPGGIFKQSHDHGLNLEYNHTDSVWLHENGSRGRLAGAETRADIEYLRGAAAEADIAIVDEGKSFAPDLLRELVDDILEPGLMTRDGILVFAGTPGSIPVGPFYEATCEFARIEDIDSDDPNAVVPSCVLADEEHAPMYNCFDEAARKSMWRLHTWTIEDNTAKPGQWERAKRIKKKNKWGDDHPTWRREYLGIWVTDATDLVYAWLTARAANKSVTWIPNVTPGNITGLPQELGPWHLVMGLDLGYVDESAFVLAAYSESVKELRHVYDYKKSEMVVDDFAAKVLECIEIYGMPEAIVADTGGGGAKMIIEQINQKFGLGIIPAEKKDKQAYIELQNSEFHSERIKIIPGTDLAHELGGLQWDLSKNSKLILARTGRLKEDPNCPNHLTDAFLYIYKYSYHFWSELPAGTMVKGTQEWWAAEEKRIEEEACARHRERKNDKLGLKRIAANRPMTREDLGRFH